MSSPATPTARSTASVSSHARTRKPRISRRVKVAAVLLILLVALGLAAKPAYRAWRDQRIDRNLEAAKEAARLEDWTSTRDLSRSVWIARREDFEAFRLMARALAKLGEPGAYMAAGQVFRHPDASREDRLESLRVMTLQAPHAITLGSFASLPEADQKQADFRAAIIPVILQQGEFEFAENLLRAASGIDTPPAARLELLRVLCARPSPERVDEARWILAELVKADASEEALAALVILGETPDGLAAGSPLPELIEWTKRQPKATTLHHLLALRPAIEAAPGQSERYYQMAIDRFLATDPGVLGTWLVRQGRAEQALELLAEPAKTRSDAFLARIHAMLLLKRDDEIETELAQAPAAADPVEMEIVRAVLAGRRGDADAAKQAWTRAMDAAAADNSRNRFIELARHAKYAGANATVEDAWVAAIRVGWGPLPLHRYLQPVFDSLASQGRAEDLLAISRSMLRYEPRNPDLIHKVQYLSLIQNLLPAGEIARNLVQLVEAFPQSPEFNSSLMIAEISDGRPRDALARLPKLRESSRVSPMMVTAIEGTARILDGSARVRQGEKDDQADKVAAGKAEIEAGNQLLEGVDWDLFMRDERIFFSNLLVRNKVAGIQLPEPEPARTEIDPDQVPAWRKAIERLEQDRANDVLPALPDPRLPGADARQEPEVDPVEP
jgi:hypothetical protein